jgi:hypothetical protein
VAEPGPTRRQPGWLEVLTVAAAVVAVVLGLDLATGLLPTELADIVVRTPLAIAVLLIGTGWILWRIARRHPPTT